MGTPKYAIRTKAPLRHADPAAPRFVKRVLKARDAEENFHSGSVDITGAQARDRWCDCDFSLRSHAIS